MSLVEAMSNVLVGYGLAVLTQLLVFPWFGLPARVGDLFAREEAYRELPGTYEAVRDHIVGHSA